MIANAMDKVGKEGVISLEEGKSMTTELEVTEGMRFDKGYISPYFATDTERMEAVLDEPYILLTDKKIALVQDLVPVLEQIAKTGKPLVIIAEDIEKEALENSKPISDSNAIAQCGTIAAGNDDEVGQMIANAMDKVGKEGVIFLRRRKINDY